MEPDLTSENLIKSEHLYFYNPLVEPKWNQEITGCSFIIGLKSGAIRKVICLMTI